MIGHQLSQGYAKLKLLSTIEMSIDDITASSRPTMCLFTDSFLSYLSLNRRQTLKQWVWHISDFPPNTMRYSRYFTQEENIFLTQCGVQVSLFHGPFFSNYINVAHVWATEREKVPFVCANRKRRLLTACTSTHCSETSLCAKESQGSKISSNWHEGSAAGACV